MGWHRSWAPAAWVSVLCIGGCTTLREVPRADFGVRAERRACRVWTHDGLVYDFDYASVTADTLLGFRDRSAAAATESMVRIPIALEDIERLTMRAIDWRRTGLIGGGVLAGLFVAGSARSSGDGAPGTRSGGGGGNGEP